MSEIKHTQAPWMLNGEAQLLTEGDVIHISDLAGRNLATVWTSKQQTYGVGRANAQRIVYCVNACEGVSPEDLKGLSVKGLLDCYLQDDKAKKELEKRLESARADAKHQKELYEYVSALNSRLAVEKRELEAELKDAKKLVKKQVDDLTASHNFESQLRQENRALQQENHTLQDDQNRLLELREELEKMRLGKEHLAKDLQAIIRAARWGQAPYAVDISTLQAVLQHYGVLPNGD